VNDAVQLGNAAKQKNAATYREIVKALVPIAQRLAGIFGEEGITASTVRRHALRLNIINENTPLHFLSSVMKQAGLKTSGVTRPSTIAATKGRRQLVYYADSPYAG
jgi:hypothetical protein